MEHHLHLVLERIASCIAKNFADLEIQVAIIQLLRILKFTVDADDMKFNRSVKVALTCDPPIIIRVTKL